MAMSVEKKIAMGEKLFGIMKQTNNDPHICELAIMGMIGSLALNGENPGVIWEVLPLALAEHYTKDISDALVDGIKNMEDGDLKSFKDDYNRMMSVGIESGKKINPNIVASVTPFRAILGHAFIEAGKRICNGEAEK